MVDLGALLKEIAKPLLTYAFIFGFFGIVGFGYTSMGGPTIPAIPDVFWRAVTVLSLVWYISFLNNRSYHVFNFEFYFPKLNWLGIVFLSAYIFGLWELFLFGPKTDVWLSLAEYYVAVMPFVIFLTVIKVGHARLMERREGRLPSKDIADYF